MIVNKKFIGLWQLEAEKADYEPGNSPVEGTYQISRDGDKLRFDMNRLDIVTC